MNLEIMLKNLNVMFVKIYIKKKKTKIINKKHYNCPLPKNPLTNKIDYSNSWTRQWILEKCSAKILNYYLQNNLTINMENFERDKIKLYDRNEC